jgi:hypothetical protein
MSDVKYTPGLNREQIFAIAEPYGAFEFGDAQGNKRLEFAADVIAAHKRLRDAAPDLLAALEDMLAGWKYIRSFHGDLYGVGWDRAQTNAEAAIAKATGAPHAPL